MALFSQLNMVMRRMLLLAVGTSTLIGITEYISQRTEAQIVKPHVAAHPNLGDIRADVQRLVSFGPRVAGTPVTEQAIAYLREEYRQAGYVTRVQTFTYPQFKDNGSNLTVNGTTIEGRALSGSPRGNLTAPLVAVPNVGRRADFEAVNVRGAIALVQRGEIRFLDKANNAAAAGAVGLIIINNVPGNFSGTLGAQTSIPVLALGSEQGSALLKKQPLTVTLNVNTEQRLVTGRNLIAHPQGVTQPKLLLGAHYDSVAGSPGANDNASGTAVVLNIARRLARSDAHSVWFVAFDGEEDGLQGSSAFVRAAPPQFLSHLQGMMNFDMVGVNERLSVSGSPALTALAQNADRSIATLGGSGGSDHVPFADAEVPVLFFTRGLDPNYHKPSDVQIEPRLLDETVEVGLTVVSRLKYSDPQTQNNLP